MGVVIETCVKYLGPTWGVEVCSILLTHTHTHNVYIYTCVCVCVCVACVCVCVFSGNSQGSSTFPPAIFFLYPYLFALSLLCLVQRQHENIIIKYRIGLLPCTNRKQERALIGRLKKSQRGFKTKNSVCGPTSPVLY